MYAGQARVLYAVRGFHYGTVGASSSHAAGPVAIMRH